MRYEGIEYDVPAKCPECGRYASDETHIVKETTPYGDEMLTVTYKCRICGNVFDKIYYKK